MRRASGACVIWPGRIGSHGYGMVGLGKKSAQELAHRFCYALSFGPVPDGMQLHHLCHNRLCVNPAHLEPISASEHTRRHGHPESFTKSRLGQPPVGVAAIHAAKTACPKGHAYDYAYPNGRRGCKRCIGEHRRINEQKARAAA